MNKKRIIIKSRTIARVTLVMVLLIILAAVAAALAGCTEAEKISYNVSEEADNFNIFRRLAVINDRTDKVIFELDGYFSINADTEDGQLEVVCEVGDGSYKKHIIGLSKDTVYTIEDLSGAVVDKYHYEIHYLPEGNVINFKFKNSK